MRYSGAGSILDAIKPAATPPDGYYTGEPTPPVVPGVSAADNKDPGVATGGLY